MINIGGDSNDPTYRHKRNINRLGVQTEITNLEIIAKQLNTSLKRITNSYIKCVKRKPGRSNLIIEDSFLGNLETVPVAKIPKQRLK
uniref:Uncharacterized protein n=1 Tax=Pithovirus LCDPAC01 TaxID=2506600 RepID=A0A481YP02_9VIRU|nr:MAG: hypothetical protein LCDPAC01_00230 [Pithovirus LCDPAC01]